MGKVVHLANPFDPLQRDVHEVRRPMTVRRFLSRRREMRRHTSVRRIDGPYGGRRVREFDRPTVCLHNGRALKRSEWSTTVIHEGDLVVFNTLPGFGGGAGSIIGIIAAIAISVAAPWLAGLAVGAVFGSAAAAAAAGFGTGSIGLGLLSAGIGIALAAATAGLMSLFSPPAAAANQISSAYGGTGGVAAQTSPTYSLQAQGNTGRLGQPIPVLHGRHMIYPDYVTLPYTRYVANEQYIHALLAVTQGECDIEAVRIGDTPIASFEEITWEKVEPADLPDEAIVDARWLVCHDLAQIELPDSAAGSAWKGPFAANPAGTEVDGFEIDLIAPRGLYKYNTSGGFDNRSVTVVVEAQEIDDTGATVGSWGTIDTIVKTAGANEPQRYTQTYSFPSAGRWQVRVKRTDTMDTAASAGHQIDWAGLRGKLTSVRRFASITCLAVKMKATGDLNSQTSRQVNCIATRKLATWDPETEAMTTSVAATRSLCDAFADICLNQDYGARLPESKVDLAGLYASKAEFDELGWSFDFVWDQNVTQWDALGRVARACVGVQVVQGGKVRLVRDVASTAPVMMFTPRNIRQGSYQIEYKMVDDQTADAVIGTYMDTNSWKPVTLIEAFDDSPQVNPTTVQYPGVTYRGQLRACLWNLLRSNRYRRRITGWGTEMAGLPLLYGDPVSVSHDMMAWGQAAEVIDWDADTSTLTLSETMVFTADATHYVAIRKPNGTLAGPFQAIDGGANRLIVGEGTLPTIYTGGDRERTIIQFGPGEAYARRVKIISMQPRDEWTAEVLAIDDDPRMYDAVPDEVEEVPPVGAPTEDLVVHIAAPASIVNLRAVANAAGYTGNPVQAVTIIIDEGVEVTTVVRGTWPAGVKPTLINLGTISGAHGGPGAPGGTALDCTSGAITVDNADATIRGGGGGGGFGGTGGTGGYAYFEYTEASDFGSFTTTYTANGGPGGVGGAGGAGGGFGGSGGGAGTGGNVVFAGTYSGTGGTGGAGGSGGTGGGYGAAGSAGSAGAPGGTGTTDGENPSTPPGSAGAGGGAGGAAGKAVAGNANITWIGTGTRTGPIA